VHRFLGITVRAVIGVFWSTKGAVTWAVLTFDIFLHAREVNDASLPVGMRQISTHSTLTLLGARAGPPPPDQDPALGHLAGLGVAAPWPDHLNPEAPAAQGLQEVAPALGPGRELDPGRLEDFPQPELQVLPPDQEPLNGDHLAVLLLTGEEDLASDRFDGLGGRLDGVEPLG